MSKKLKIQFWKAEGALAMQILEQEGLPSCKEDGFVHINDFPWIYRDGIDLRGYDSQNDLEISRVQFDTNTKCDACLEKIVNAITDELFTDEGGELKVDEMCEVSDDGVSWHKYRLLGILPEHYEMRFLIENGKLSWCSFRYARPIHKRAEPIVEGCGNVITYTWEQ